MGDQSDRRYSRVYHEALDDPKFLDVWDDDARLSLWVRLLVAADMAWPASATLPRSTRRSALASLVECGLVDLVSGDRYRIHGLDPERNARSNAARIAADVRWHKNGNAEVMPNKRREGKDIQGSNGTVKSPRASRPVDLR